MPILTSLPEGVLNRCPSCRADIPIPQDVSAGELPCPGCGRSLFLTHSGESIRYFDPVALRAVLMTDAVLKRKLSEKLGIAVEELKNTDRFQEDLGMDSLDVVEWTMELEEAFDVAIPDDGANDIRTVEDAARSVEKAVLRKGTGS